MGRDRQRATLDGGIGLNLNLLIRQGGVRPGYRTVNSITWTDTNYGEEIANAVIISDLTGSRTGSFKIVFDDPPQEFMLVSRERHFGGHQWYFYCPRTHRICSTLWMPSGAGYFASRQAWGRRLAYASQFDDATSRAHRGQAKLKKRLCKVGGYDPADWDFPPKPKRMRWKTYNRADAKYDRYERVLDLNTFALIAKFTGMKV